MLKLMLRRLLIAVCTTFLMSVPASAASFTLTGAWGVKWCDKDPQHACGGFYLYLVQQGNRICGDHFYATLNVGRLNEGGPKSIIGVVSGTKAKVTIRSGRNNSVFRAHIKRSGKTLDWLLLEQIKTGEGDEPLIHEKARLVRLETANAKENLNRVIRECDAL